MVSDHWSPLWSHIAPSGWCSSALQSPGERKRWNHNQIKNWGSTLNSLSISPCLQSWPRLPRNSLNKLRWIFGIDLAIGNQAKKLNSCQKGFRLIFAEWKLLKKHLGIVAPLTCWRQQGELPAMSQKPFWLFWCNDSHSLAPPHCHFSWAICVTADRVVWPQISWWQSSFVSAAQLYPGLPLFCRWASTFPGYLSTFPMHGFLQRRQVLLDVRESSSSRSMVLGCSPPLSSPNPAEAGKGTHHHQHYPHMASTQLLVHRCLPVDMMLRQRLRLDDQNWEPKIVKC